MNAALEALAAVNVGSALAAKAATAALRHPPRPNRPLVSPDLARRAAAGVYDYNSVIVSDKQVAPLCWLTSP